MEDEEEMAQLAKRKKDKVMKFGLQGFMRVNITKDGTILGDSGRVKNTITDYGLDEGLAQRLLGGAVYGQYAALGTGGSIATNTTLLPNEIAHIDNRESCSTTTNTSATAGAVTARWYGTVASSEGYVTASTTIGNIGIYSGQSTNSSTLLCGATYTQSTLDTNQDVNYTYEWQFATTT